MTKNQIIEELFKSKNFNDCINKMEPEHIRDDLKGEVLLIVCEWDEEKILNLYNKKELDFYVVRVILNLARSSSSPFAKKFRQPVIEFNQNQHIIIDNIDLPDRLEKDKKEDFILQVIDEVKQGKEAGLYWYNAGILQLYIKHGNYRAIEKETGIPFISCYKNLKKTFAELKRRTEKLNYEKK